MNNKKSLVFNLDLSGFYTQRREKLINTLQEYSEYLFDMYQDSSWIYENSSYYNDNKQAAIDYLLSKNFTMDEIDQFKHVLESDVNRALSDAFNSNYQDEWLEKYRKLLDEKIDALLDETNTGAKNITDIQAPKFWELEAVQVSIDKDEAIKYLDDYNYNDMITDQDIIESLENYILEQVTPINTEYIDYYGTLGSFDNWLDCFKDYNEIENTIAHYRQAEKEKINNFESLLVNTLSPLKQVTTYIDKYINQEPQKTKLKRQVNALQSLLKNIK